MHVKTSENHTEMKSEPISERKKIVECPLSQSREVLILNYFMDIIFFFNLDTLSFGRKFRRLLDAGRIFFLSKNVRTASIVD